MNNPDGPLLTNQELYDLGVQVQEAISAAAEAISGTHEAMLLLTKAVALQPCIDIDQLTSDLAKLIEKRYRPMGPIPAAVVNANAQLASLKNRKS